MFGKKKKEISVLQLNPLIIPRNILLLVTFLLASCNGVDKEAKTDSIKPNVTSQVKSEISLNSSSDNKTALKLFAEELLLEYQVVSNREEIRCDPEKTQGKCFAGQITLSLMKPIALNQWKLFFSHMSPIQQEFSHDFDIVHVNGDLHYIKPTEKFAGWNGNKHFEINFIAGFWHLSEFDSPPNFYVVDESGVAITISSTIARIDPETGLEYLPHVKPMDDINKHFKRSANDQTQWATAEYLYNKNQQTKQDIVDVSHRIIPKPKKTILLSKHQKLDISSGIYLKNNYLSESFNANANRKLSQNKNVNLNNPGWKRLEMLGIATQSKNGIPVVFEESAQLKNNGAYNLIIKDQQILIQASGEQGYFYGLQSLAALYVPTVNTLPLVKVVDEPRFNFRGLHIDIARNFRNKHFMLKLLDQMAAYKLNKLHLHLADDEGWRLEIPGLPELTQVGGQRCFDLNELSCLKPQLGSGPDKENINNGHFSAKDYQQLLVEAKRRHIEVIPSFDMPGHSRAAVISMQARYKKFLEKGEKELAEEFLLSDINDKSRYSSVQFYSDNTLNVCMDSTYRFVEKVISEVALMHRQVGVPLNTYHIGADETPGAWTASPQCNKFIQQESIRIDDLASYFVVRVSHFLASKNIQAAGWSDGMTLVDPGAMPEQVQVNSWTPLYWGGHQVAHTLANRNWQVILSLPDVTYFDFPYEADPKERGYYWGARGINSRKVFEFMPENLPLHAEIWNDRENQPMVLDDRSKSESQDKAAYLPLAKGKKFSGIQAHLWSEMVRSEDIAEYLLFPRLLALAERAWHKAEWEPEYNHKGVKYSPDTHYLEQKQIDQRERDWQDFANTVALKEMPKLDSADWLYRLPTVGAKVNDGILVLNSPFPGLSMEFRLGQNKWQKYPAGEAGVKVKPGVEISVRSESPSGKRKGRTLKFANPK